MHIIGQGQMAEYHRPPTNRAARPNDSAAGDPCTPSHGSVVANAHVVADLNEVIEFDTIAQDRISQGATINTSVGTNLTVITQTHVAELLNFDPSPLVRRKTKAIGPDDDARMQHRTCTHLTTMLNGDAGMQHRICADPRTRPHKTEGTNQGAMGNFCPRLDTSKRANHHALMNDRTRVYRRSGMMTRA